MPAPTKVQYMTNLWEQRIASGSQGTLPMGFDMSNDRREVPDGRTTGTVARYEQKRAAAGDIPYYTFDRYSIFQNPNNQVRLLVVRSGGRLDPTIVATGALAFVIMNNGEFRVAPPLGIGGGGGLGGRINHAHIADMATTVIYAGTISFGTLGAARGLLNWWNNDSGAYRCSANTAPSAGLPMDRYDAPRWATGMGAANAVEHGRLV